MFGLKGIQDAIYNPYHAEPVLTELKFHGRTSYSASLTFNFDVDSFGKIKQIDGSLIIKDPSTKKEYEYTKMYIPDGKDLYLPSFIINLDTTSEDFKEMYTVGFDKLDYYFKVKSVSFNIGTTNLANSYSVKLNSKEYTYTSNGSYIFS